MGHQNGHDGSSSILTAPVVPAVVKHVPSSPSPVTTRQRISFTEKSFLDGYDIEVRTIRKVDPHGDYLSSRITGGHLPLLDVDYPVDAMRTSHGYQLWIEGPVSAGIIVKALKRLAKHGYTDPDWARRYRADLRKQCGRFVGWFGRDVELKSATLLVNVPIEVHRSSNARHRHLYVQQVMSMRESVRFARALGIVDSRHINIAGKDGDWIVRLAD